MRNYKPRFCKVCNKEFIPRSPIHKYCSNICDPYYKQKLKYRIRICKTCNKKFTPNRHNHKYCRKECTPTYKAKLVIKIKICNFCNKKFIPKSKSQKYCKNKCTPIYRLKQRNKICKICNKKFTPNHYLQKCCSNECKKKRKILLACKRRERINKKPQLKNRINKCKKCNNKFKPGSGSQKYCVKCRKFFNRKKFCIICGKEIDKSRVGPKVYCSQICYNKKRIKNIEKICIICNKKFIVKAGNQKYCSKKCSLPQYKIRQIITSTIYLLPKYKNSLSWQKQIPIKYKEALKYLGCDIDFFIKYFESKFKSGMSWSNHGKAKIKAKTWQLDHIKPISSFNLAKEEDRKICFHHTNMQPLWWWKNLSKGNKVI